MFPITFDYAAEIIRNTFMNNYPQVKRAYIFGSLAEGLQTDNSDIDLMVEFNAPMGFDFFGMINDVEKAVQNPVDLITVNQAKELESKYEYDIFGKAKLVYERKS